MSRAWWLALAVAVALRLAMGADRDILAINQPYDDSWFIFTASRDIWPRHYDQLVFAQLQLFAIWLKLVNVFGIPARLAIDLAWLGSAIYAAAAVNRLCRAIWPGAVLFVYLAFHPFSFVLFDRALSENLMACLTVVVVGAMLDVWNYRAGGPRPSRGLGQLALLVGSLAFAGAYHCRKEGFLMWFPLAILIVGTLLDRAGWWKGGLRSAGLAVIVAPVAATVLLGVALAGANAAHYGVFARYELGAPGYQRAVKALNAIAPPAPTPRFVTVTAATRATAYAVSPTFRELQNFLDGPGSEALTKQAEIYNGVKGEIGNGWFYWTLRDAAASVGWHRSAVDAERKYAAMSDEIERAMDDGRLPRRTVLVPFVDPDWHKWLPYLPAALLAEWKQTVVPTEQSMYRLAENALLTEKETYLKVAGRRRPFGYARISGWLTAPEGSRVGIVSGEEPGAWIVLAGPPRPDVANAIQFEVEAPGYTQYTQLLVDTPDHRRGQIHFYDMTEDHVYPLAPGIVLGVDRLSDRPSPPWIDAALPAAIRIWSVAGWAFTAAGALGVAVAIWQRRSTGIFGLFLLASFAAIASRVGLLAVLDTTSWSGGSRYLLPIVPFVALLGALGFGALVEAVSPGRKRDVV